MAMQDIRSKALAVAGPRPPAPLPPERAGDGVSRSAVRILWMLVAIKLAMGANVMLRPARVAADVDGIPLASYGPDAAGAVVAFFALWGLGQLLLGAIGAAVLMRHRALVASVFALFLAEQVGRRILFLLHPIGGGGLPAPSAALAINLVLFVLTCLGLWLALRGERDPARRFRKDAGA